MSNGVYRGVSYFSTLSAPVFAPPNDSLSLKCFIYTGKIDNYKPFKFLLKFALWHDFLVHFSFCLKVR